MKRYKIVDYKRFYIFIIISIIISSLMGVCLVDAVSSYGRNIDYDNLDYFEVVVSPGDTIWDIANRYSYNDGDIRDMVYMIKKYNNINNSLKLKESHIIKIPLEQN